MLKRLPRKGAKVWFVDAMFNKAGVEEFYPEYGFYVGKSEREGFVLIDIYFSDDNVEFNRDALFPTKEDCEQYLMTGGK